MLVTLGYSYKVDVPFMLISLPPRFVKVVRKLDPRPLVHETCWVEQGMIELMIGDSKSENWGRVDPPSDVDVNFTRAPRFVDSDSVLHKSNSRSGSTANVECRGQVLM